MDAFAQVVGASSVRSFVTSVIARIARECAPRQLDGDCGSELAPGRRATGTGCWRRHPAIDGHRRSGTLATGTTLPRVQTPPPAITSVGYPTDSLGIDFVADCTRQVGEVTAAARGNPDRVVAPQESSGVGDRGGHISAELLCRPVHTSGTTVTASVGVPIQAPAPSIVSWMRLRSRPIVKSRTWRWKAQPRSAR
jgi:hypothetical protein